MSHDVPCKSTFDTICAGISIEKSLYIRCRCLLRRCQTFLNFDPLPILASYGGLAWIVPVQDAFGFLLINILSHGNCAHGESPVQLFSSLEKHTQMKSPGFPLFPGDYEASSRSIGTYRSVERGLWMIDAKEVLSLKNTPLALTSATYVWYGWIETHEISLVLERTPRQTFNGWSAAVSIERLPSTPSMQPVATLLVYKGF